jgi:4,4'-diaponeurosporenoate glycosyltransferase
MEHLIIYVVFWLLGYLFLAHIPYCTVMSEDKKGSPPSVSIIIPARNEETTLPFLLASIKKQRHKPAEIIVVDDLSADRTRAVAERAGVRVIDSKPLPRGWVGKMWSCYQGAGAATGAVLIFLDADTFLAPDGLQKIIDTYRRKKGVISISPYHATEKLYEKLSAFFNIVMMGAMNAFTLAGDLIRPTGVFGPALVISREDYFKSGGHKQVKDKIIEGVFLPEQFKKARIPIRCYGGKGSLSFRMYPHGIKDLIGGWSKGFATGAIQTSIPALIIVVAWIVGCVGVTRYLIETAFMGSATVVIAWAALYLCYVLQIYWMLFRIGRFKFYTALLFPIPLLFFIVVFARSIILIFLKRSVQWKGRSIDTTTGRSS